jgi:hypothetical protein
MQVYGGFQRLHNLSIVIHCKVTLSITSKEWLYISSSLGMLFGILKNFLKDSKLDGGITCIVRVNKVLGLVPSTGKIPKKQVRN